MRPFLVFSNSREFLLITAFTVQRNVFALPRLEVEPGRGGNRKREGAKGLCERKKKRRKSSQRRAKPALQQKAL